MNCNAFLSRSAGRRLALPLRGALAIWLVAVCLIGCGTRAPQPALARYEFSRPLMGTRWTITLYAPDFATASNAVRAAFARVAALEDKMSDYYPDSELMLLTKAPPGRPVRVSDDLFDALREALRLARQTDGAYDPTVGLEVNLWRRARRQHEFPPAARLEQARQTVGYKKLKLDARAKTVTLLDTNVWLDLGGIGKGYAADAALGELYRHGLPRALVAASGDLAIGDPPPGKKGWRVGVGLPEGGDTNLAVQLLLHNVGVSTSGDTEQFVEFNGVRYSHIVNPRTGLGLTNRLQATIIADRATRSDALATAVCVLGPEDGLKMIERDRRAAALLILPGNEASSARPTLLKSCRFGRLEQQSR